MKIFRIIAVLLLLLGSLSVAVAEDIKKFKYGKVTEEELRMTTYDKDTSAVAVVLQQYAEFIPQQFNFLQQYRIKVLKKDGTGKASMVFDGKIKQYIKGCTYNLENGEVVKSKLERESIFEERVVGHIYRTRIAMPNVKVGSVFEVQILREGIPNAYEIQWDIPVIYGAIYFPKNPNVDIRIKEIGYLGYTFKGDDKWIVKDLPSFKYEPYITSDNDYRLRMEFEVLSLNFSGVNYSVMGFFASSWGAVSKNFRESEYFGKRLSEMALFLNDLDDSIKNATSNVEEQAQMAYDKIKQIKWNGQEACFTSQELKKTFQLKQGNSADINFNLIHLFKKFGLKSYPVLFSTRGNGRISKYSPTLNKFNYVIAAVELPSGTKFVDATDEFTPFGMPTERILGCLGHPVEEGKPECSVLIEPQRKHKRTTFSQFKVDSTGSANGTVSIRRSDYNAVDFKNYLKGKPDHETYIQELEAENSGWYINDFKFNNLNNPYKEFAEEYQVSYSNSIGATDLILFNPFAFTKTNQNPFQKDKRYLPISFPQQTEYTSVVSVTVPANYQIAELPKNVDIANTDKTMRFTYQVQTVGNTITISTKFTINKLQYETIEYPSIRGVYEMMLQKQNEAIVLKKI